MDQRRMGSENGVMKKQVKSRDWEALSAYLDGQLSNRERSRLEARLENDRDLQLALEELRKTQGVLRNLPTLRVPRNFTLTPQMVGIKQESQPLFPVLRFASIVAMVLLAVVVIGDYMFPATLALAPVSEADTFMMAPSVVAEKEAESVVAESVYPYPVDALGMVEPAAEAATDKAMMEAEPEAATQKVRATEEGSVLQQRVRTPTPAATLADVEHPYPAVEESITIEKSAVDDGSKRDTVFRVVEVALLIIAIGTGVAAFVLRRGTIG